MERVWRVAIVMIPGNQSLGGILSTDVDRCLSGPVWRWGVCGRSRLSSREAQVFKCRICL